MVIYDLKRLRNINRKWQMALSIISTLLEKYNVLLTGANFTIADALLAPMLAYLANLPAGYNLLPDYPAIEKYLSKLMARPSCHKILLTK